LKLVVASRTKTMISLWSGLIKRVKILSIRRLRVQRVMK
jgi:hypothetical protein